MKKVFKTCLILSVTAILLLAAAVSTLYFLDFCPPPGPWPAPPWCSPGEAASLPDVSLKDLSKMVDLNPTEQPAPEPYALPADFQTIFNGPEWEQDPQVSPDFMLGHTFMDIYTTGLYKHSLSQTIQAMENTGADWVVYDNYWSYESLDPPTIRPFPTTPGFRNASKEEICQMKAEAQQRNMKFALMLELNFDLAMGGWQGWDYAGDFWTASQKILEEKGEHIPENQSYWETWFQQYSVFVLDQAEIARDCQVDLFVIGKQIDGAVKTALKPQWRTLVAQVREIYPGPISYAAYTDSGYTQMEEFPGETLDYLIFYVYNNLTEKENPSVDDLVSAFEQLHDQQFEPLSQKTGKPVIFLTPFQSRDFGARQEWFEPAAPAPDVGEDLLIQAQMYEALFQSLEDEDWVSGVFTWGFWWRDDFNRLWEENDASFNKSSSVRNKPAEWIFKKWAESREPTY